MEAIGSSETLGTVYNITWWHNPKNYNPSSCHWKLQTLYSFTCCIDVKLGLSLRKGLWDSNFTSLLGHYKSPGWWQQDMTCVLSTQRSIWYQVGHVCLKNPTLCCALPSSCCILLLPHGGLLPCMFSSGWRQVPTPFTWILYSFPAFTQGSSMSDATWSLVYRLASCWQDQEASQQLFLPQRPWSTASTILASRTFKLPYKFLISIVILMYYCILEINAVGMSPTFTGHQPVVSCCLWTGWNA